MKAQAALEFLMTYGWAILIVIAVVAALYAMGVFTLPGGSMNPCSPCFPTGGDMTYVAHNSTHLLVRVGAHKVRYGGSDYESGQVITVDISPTCSGVWDSQKYCDFNFAYSLLVDSTELGKTVLLRLHRTW
ncbi:MAG: hypothetical protein QXL86_01820 [Candidatus Aenigmatarchaeota archaeon]